MSHSALLDPERLQSLRQSGLLDSGAEEAFDRLTRLASALLKAPVSLVSLVDSNRQYFKSMLGLPQHLAPGRQTPLSHSICQHVVASGQPLAVEDARVDPLLVGNLAAPELGVVAYLGMPMTTAQGQCFGSFCVIDHQPRQWSESEVNLLRDLTSSLMTEIELRGAVKLQSGLRRQAESANASKSAFLASVSHELRTPLNGILGMAELTLATSLQSEQRECLELLEESAQHLLELVNDVLDLSKIESGHLDLHPGSVNLREELGLALRPLLLKAEARGLDLVLHFEPEVPCGVLADGSRLRQILVNLVGNSIKFTPPGGRILVRISKSAEQIRFSVTDTGIGIPEDKLHTVFEPFEQVDNRLTREQVGTGLGLSIVRRLVMAMGGEIDCQSRLGQGTQISFGCSLEASLEETPPDLRGVHFVGLHPNRERMEACRDLVAFVGARYTLATEDLAILREDKQAILLVDGQSFEPARIPPGNRIFLLGSPFWEPPPNCPPHQRLSRPVTPRELEAAVRGLRPPSPDSSTTPTRESLRVLLAEDNRINQKVARAMLERAGHCVTLAENGRIALERLEEAVFDVALVDIQMPEVDGFGVAREVRAREQAGRARTYLIALTAQAMAGDRELCLAAGFDTYLSKPISQNDLNAGLQTFLQSHRLSE